MVHFVLLALKVKFLIWILLIASTSSDQVKIQVPDVGVISGFLRQIISPFIQFVKVEDASPAHRNFQVETPILQAIQSKIAELRPLLEDEDNLSKGGKNDKTDGNNLTLEGNDETTIIEFLPKINSKRHKGKPVFRVQTPETDPFQTNINKYKKLKKTIIKKLEEENTANSTKLLITRTLDDMIAQLIERKCTWNTKDNKIRTQVFRTRVDTSGSINKLRSLTSQDWKDLRTQYLHFLKSKAQQNDYFLEQFHDFFTSVLNDTLIMSDRYKVRCQLVKIDDPPYSKQYLRVDKSLKRAKEEKNECGVFKLCSDELREFLISFYTRVNDTSVSIFRNYAAMYIRDVNAENDHEKDIVVSVLENISNSAERKVSKAYKKELKNLKLDEKKNKVANIHHISDFITSTAEQVKKVVKRNLDRELGAMKTRLFATVKDDLNVNLKLDMDNLRRHTNENICKLFSHCNGLYGSRRQLGTGPKATDQLYVKVQVSLDDELKTRSAIDKLKGFFNRVKPDLRDLKEHVHALYGKHFRPADLHITNISTTKIYNNIFRKHMNVNITRTTISTSTRGTKYSSTVTTGQSTATTERSTVTTSNSTSTLVVTNINTGFSNKSVIVVDGMPLITSNDI